jgi:hypothetical protein
VTRKTHLVADAKFEAALAVTLLVVGSWLFYDAYERRGRSRPWVSRLIPSP